MSSAKKSETKKVSKPKKAEEKKETKITKVAKKVVTPKKVKAPAKKVIKKVTEKKVRAAPKKVEPKVAAKKVIKKKAEPKKVAPKKVKIEIKKKLKVVPAKAKPKVPEKRVVEKEPIKKKVAPKREKKARVVAHGVGRRKASVARVWLRIGRGLIIVNGRPYNRYFDTDVAKTAVMIPFRVVKNASMYDVEANVYGGGLHGQADAVKLGISRALLATNEDLRIILRRYGLLTVDSRLKERKKYGQRGARRKFQFVKR